jgi:ADP-L-glycero-D-manno-heptose 6-epimerase
MKVLVTGNKGFIGQHAIEKLEQLNIPYETFNWNGFLPITSLYDITHVIHLGAITSTLETDVEKVMRQNYDFTIDLLQNCNSLGIHFQFASSASVYGLGEKFTEDAPPDPRTPYAWSKYLIERYIKNNNWAIPIQVFRYFNVYGDKGEEHKGNQASPFHTFREQAKKGTIKIFENSETYARDFIHVTDVLEIQFKFLNIPESGLWNIGSGEVVSFKEVAERIADIHQADIIEIPMPEQLKNSYQQYTKADLAKLNRTLSQYSTK